VDVRSDGAERLRRLLVDLHTPLFNELTNADARDCIPCKSFPCAKQNKSYDLCTIQPVLFAYFLGDERVSGVPVQKGSFGEMYYLGGRVVYPG
jgi:hypothetical protein